jgi:hypothetical protein
VDSTVRLWNADDRVVIARVKVPAEARSAAFSVDGARIAVGLANCNVAIFKSTDLSLVSLGISLVLTSGQNARP